MNTLTTLLNLPFAKLVLAFEELSLRESSDVYKGTCPYMSLRPDGAGYVRWALDSIERLLALPHEEELDEALMRLAVHTGDAPENLNMFEIRDDLRWLCAHVQLAPPRGKEAVKLSILGMLEDMAQGLIPAGRTRELLGCLHWLVFNSNVDKALDRISSFYWQLEEWDDLSLLGLEEGLPTPDEILHDFRQYAEGLLKALKLQWKQKEGLWQLRVVVEA